MNFTNNIVIILIFSFFLFYYCLFEISILKKLHQNTNAKNWYIASFSFIFYATWFPPGILLLAYYSCIGFYGAKIINKLKK